MLFYLFFISWDLADPVSVAVIYEIEHIWMCRLCVQLGGKH